MVNDNGKLYPQSKAAVISGGSSGIGRSIALKFAAEGIKTSAIDKKPPSEEHIDLSFYKGDVTNSVDIERFYKEVNSMLGTPDILVCNAGTGIHEKLTEGDPAKWREVIDTNIIGSLHLVRAFAPGMIQKGAGDVIFISSVAAQNTYEYGGIYAATKCAIEKIADTLRLEAAPAIRVTVIAPGVTDTAFFDNMISGSYGIEELGWGSIAPEEIAEMAYYAITRKREISMNYLTVRPTLQPF